MKKSQQNLWEKVESVFLRLSQKINNLQQFLLFAILLLLPTEFGKHFWFNFSFVLGQRVDYLSPTIYLSDIFIITLFVITVILSGIKALQKKVSAVSVARPHTSKTVLFMGAGMVVYLSVGIYMSLSPLVGWYMLLKLVEFSFFAWFVATKPIVTGEKVLWSFSIGILLEGILAIAQVVHQGSSHGLWYFLGERSFTAGTPGIANASIHGQLILRPYATFSHPNVLAGYLVVGLLFLLLSGVFEKTYVKKLVSTRNTKIEMVPSGPWIRKAIIIALLIFGFFILLLTLSRIAILVFVCLSLLYVSLAVSKKKRWIVLAGSVFIGGIFISNTLLAGRFLDISAYSESIMQRNILMQSALGMVQSHPYFGVGMGNFLVTLPYYATTHMFFGFIQPVHNIFLLILAETGLGGLIAFLWTCMLAFHAAYTKWHDTADNLSRFSFFALLAVCLIGLTDHYFLTLQQGQLLSALVVGMCFRHATIELWPFTKKLQLTPSTK